MIFNILTAVVFIAELIIAYTLIINLWRIDQKLLKWNNIICLAKSDIKDIGYLIKKISAQYIEFAYDFVAKIKEKRDNSIIANLNKIIITVVLLRLNSKLVRKIMRSKRFRLLSKGLSLFQYVL